METIKDTSLLKDEVLQPKQLPLECEIEKSISRKVY